MKFFKFYIAASMITLPFSVAFGYSNFHISPACKQQIKDGLKRNYRLNLNNLNKTGTYFPDGSDDSSSWSAEWIINGTVKSKDGDICSAFIHVHNSQDCRILAVSKNYADANSYKCNF